MLFETVLSTFLIPRDIIYWVKWIISYVLIRLYKAAHQRRFDLYDPYAVNDPVKLNYLVPDIEKELESPLPESHLQHAVDEVFFYGVNSKSECLLVRISRGHNQEAEAWIYIKLANGKTYQLKQSHGYQKDFGGKCQIFSCGGLQVHYLCPMRRWRIFFCGMLKEISENMESQESTAFVKFAFRWTASSDIHDFSSDMYPFSTASGIAKAEWKYPFIPSVKKLTEALNIYAQSGVINGTISIDEGPDYAMYLFGERLRNIGKMSNIDGCKFKHILGNIPQNGLFLHLAEVSAPHVFKSLPIGFVVEPSADMKAIEDGFIITKLFAVDRSAEDVTANFTAGKKYKLTGKIVGESIVFKSGQGWSGFLDIRLIEFSIKNFKGNGLIMCGEINAKSKKKVQSLVPALLPRDIPLTVCFEDKISQFAEVSGGKGSSLGKLTELSLDDKTFVVPRGIVVTTAAYKRFLTPEILNEIKNVEDVAYGNVEGDLKEACRMIQSMIVRTSLPSEICHSIEENLNIIFNGSINQYKFAVRSSATGEDTEQMSAAGQMDTFLGIMGIKEIFTAVKKCWSSQFGHIAVEYKRQNGQLLNSPMAVVIQEMVASEVSGVLFTCDPVTNNPSVIVMTGNYGLGETVVSGSEEPDTVILCRDDDNNLNVKSVIIGAKNQKMIMKDDGGTVYEKLAESEKIASCISNELAIDLGKLAIKIEKYYRSPRDIEWGISNNTIYILQSRPVTSGTGENDYEIKHEFDAPLRCERDYFTVCNVGEVMPGAVSPLGFENTWKYFAPVFQRRSLSGLQDNDFLRTIYFPRGLVPFYNHLIMSIIELISRLDYKSTMSQGIMVGVFGRILTETEIFEIAQERSREKKQNSLLFSWYLIKQLFFADRRMKNIKKQLQNVKLGVDKCKTSAECFNAIMNSCSEHENIFDNHLVCTESSSSWNMFLIIVLAKANGSFDDNVYTDFARLLASSSDVESADIPNAMQNLACQIDEDIGSKRFKAMNAEEALNLLETSTTLAGYKFRQFIKRHGHRCLKEFDLRSTPWYRNPKSLVKLLQNLCGTCERPVQKVDDDYDEIISQLRVPLDFKSRCFLKLLLPRCRRGVRGREAAKALLVKAVDFIRQKYEHLAKMMVAEGRIPDTDLLYFLTMEEIKDLLETRSPRLIARANHRRKLFPELDKYLFPEIMRGFPKPINEDEEEEVEFVSDLVMKGIPVSQGVAKGYARVALTLEEASYLKPGEILITYGTDIGWSPYFPIVAGVVTELGGLISHVHLGFGPMSSRAIKIPEFDPGTKLGQRLDYLRDFAFLPIWNLSAVVSREYGLPCVVGLHGATRQFQTGDYVLIDGTKGLLQRLPQPEAYE